LNISSRRTVKNQNKQLIYSKGEKIMADKKYIVAARVESNNKDCIVVEEGAMIMATHRRVYGPDTKENCERWKRSNCK
jgi:hypothetical protein